MSESHAADSPADIDRAQKEAAEYAEKVKEAQFLLKDIEMLTSRGIGHIKLTKDKLELITWYVNELWRTIRQVNLMLYRESLENNGARREMSKVL